MHGAIRHNPNLAGALDGHMSLGKLPDDLTNASLRARNTWQTDAMARCAHGRRMATATMSARAKAKRVAEWRQRQKEGVEAGNPVPRGLGRGPVADAFRQKEANKTRVCAYGEIPHAYVTDTGIACTILGAAAYVCEEACIVCIGRPLYDT